MIITAYSKQNFTTLTKAEEENRLYLAPINHKNYVQSLKYKTGNVENGFDYSLSEKFFQLVTGSPFQILSVASFLPHGMILGSVGQMSFGNLVAGQIVANETLATATMFSAPIELAWGEKFRRVPDSNLGSLSLQYWLNLDANISTLNLPESLYEKTFEIINIIKIDVDKRLVLTNG